VRSEAESGFFGEGSPYLQHPLLTKERSALEIDFVQQVTDLTPPARVLDVGCGFGRHAVELAARGFETVGIDPSPAMLEAARTRADDAGIAVDWQQADGETYTTSRQFDAAICLFTTLGQVSQHGDNVGLLANLYRLLKPGAFLTIEVPQRETVVSHLKPEEELGDGANTTRIYRTFDSGSARLTERFEVRKGEEIRRFTLCFRLFSREELAGLVEKAGFAVVGLYAGYDRCPLSQPVSTAESTMILVTQK